jgi:glycosyltransferase involved in cell wall biosynthesis
MEKNIIFFVSSLDSGGIENYLLRFINFEYSNFKSIVVYCKTGKGGQLEDLYKKYNNVIIVKGKTSYFNPVSFIKLYAYLKKNKFQTVCDFSGNFAGLIVWIAFLANIKKRIVFYRGASDHFDTNFFKSIYNNFVKRLVLLNATKILSNSKAALDYFYPNQYQNDKRFEVIYNGIDASNYANITDTIKDEFSIPKDAFLVGHVGRYNVAKNHETVLKVAIALCKAHKDIFFILCGNDVQKNLYSKVADENLQKQIIVCENRTDIPVILNSLDCFYFPSLTEGQPNALIEAMIMGIPVVTSNIPPIKEMFPLTFKNQLIDPLDWEMAIMKINNIKKSQSNDTNQNLKKWALEQFSHKKQFEKFYKHL